MSKNELHAMLQLRFPRRESGADAWMVVQNNRGSESLHRWLALEFPEDFTFSRAATNKRYRVLQSGQRQVYSTSPEAPSLGLRAIDLEVVSGFWA